jgi:hypothetical protein
VKLLLLYYYYYYYYVVFGTVRDSVVGIATRYGPEGLGIESQWGGEIFQTGPGAHPASCTFSTRSVSRVKAAGT